MVVTHKWEVGLATDILRLYDNLISQQSLLQARCPLAMACGQETGRLSTGSAGAQSLAFVSGVHAAPALVTGVYRWAGSQQLLEETLLLTCTILQQVYALHIYFFQNN